MEMIQLTTLHDRPIFINPKHIISVEQYLVHYEGKDVVKGSKLKFSGHEHIGIVSETMDLVLEKLNKRID